MSELQDANNKSNGIDDQPGELYNHSFHIISSFLLSLLNKVFQKGEYPSSWTVSITVPVFKDGNIDNVTIYRGITLTSIISEIYSNTS